MRDDTQSWQDTFVRPDEQVRDRGEEIGWKPRVEDSPRFSEPTPYDDPNLEAQRLYGKGARQRSWSDYKA